jgi:hypothetical protein
VIALHGNRNLRSRFYAAGQRRNLPRAKVWIVSFLGKRRHQYRLDAVREKLLLALDYSSMDSVPKPKMVCNTNKWHTKTEECHSGMP